MPYLTPDSIPESDDCRSLLIPASTDWLAIVSGALTELVKPYNWAQFGAVTVEEAVARMQAMIDAYYAGCAACTTPGGYRIIRIGVDGYLEELGDDGGWVEPTGDYIIPQPAAREGGTEQDQICLAAANATFVLEQLYETLTEAWASHLSEAEALTEFIAALIAIVGFEFAPISWAIAAFFLAAFALLYSALEYLGADLWDADFTNQMKCFLVACASNEDGVVTFDWVCFTGQLNTLSDTFGLTELQLRLYIQVCYMLNFIGGVEGLNLAGGTTALTAADCSDCADAWVIGWDFCGSMEDWAIWHACGNLVADGIEQVDDCEGEPSLASADLVYNFGSGVIEQATLFVTDEYAPNSHVKVYAGAPLALDLIYEADNPTVPVVITGLALTGNVEFLWLWSYSGNGHRDRIQGAWFSGVGATPGVGTLDPDAPPCYVP